MTAVRRPEAASSGEERVPFALLTFVFHREGTYWVGKCRELGTATDGRSLIALEHELTALVALHLEGLAGIGELEPVFAERGIRLFTNGVPAEVTSELPVARDGGPLIQIRAIPLPAPAISATS